MSRRYFRMISLQANRVMLILPVMKMTMLPEALYRVPQFSYTADLSTNWDELKESIRRSSAVFYQLIQNLSYEDLATQPETVRHTVWKYFNRAKFRATPYGSFAGIGMVQLNAAHQRAVILADQQTLHGFCNWPLHEHIAYSFEELIERDVRLWVNHTWYIVGKDIRYVGHFQEGYMLVDTSCTIDQRMLLAHCSLPIRISVLIDAYPPDQQKHVLHMVEQFLDQQLLFCELHPNIIGTDYFERIGHRGTRQEQSYLIAKRPVVSGSVSTQIFRHIPSLLERLQQLLPSYYCPDLRTFKAGFLKKFRGREVPLMVALDPEIGVGYGDMDVQANGGDLIRKLAVHNNAPAVDDQLSTLNLLLPLLSNGSTAEIDIESLPLPDLPDNHPLPNTLSVLCTVVDDTLHLEHLGGATATSLLGRFTLADDGILAHAKNSAAIEAQANPQTDFFDIGYLTGSHVDNVNRRKAIYPQQLTLLHYDTSEIPLSLSDVMVCVQKDEVILYSKRTNKRLVPKLATAYNYLLSDLPVFRFLCDLQHQGIHKNLYLRLRDRIPDLEYYPRVKYRNIVLSPATWKIEWKRKGESSHADLERLSELLASRSVRQYVKTGRADQTLFFNILDQSDQETLLFLLKKEGSLYLEEAALPNAPDFQNTQGSPFLPQLLITCSHDREIYPAYQPAIFRKQQGSQDQFFMPADGWLYLEIYCHPARMDALLCSRIAPLIQRHQDRIEQWFFIRYSENGHHLRFRVKMMNKNQLPELLSALNDLLRPDIAAGIISDMIVRSYHRETERYGEAHIEHAESHFTVDSDYALQIITSGATEQQKYISCMQLIEAIAETDIFEAPDFSALIENNSNSFNREHRFGPAEFRQLNHFIKSLHGERADLQPWTEEGNSLIQSLKRLLSRYDPSERPSIFSSLIHMHINRLFTADQRTHEAVIYYLAARRQRRDVARSGKKKII